MTNPGRLLQFCLLGAESSRKSMGWRESPMESRFKGKCSMMQSRVQSFNLQVEVLQQHRTPVLDEELWESKHRVVYGPVASRRLGESLGINLFPKTKICSFNCRYCDVGPTPPSATQFLQEGILRLDLVKEEIEKGISEHLKSGKTIDYITICGNGEATDYPYFVDVARFLLELRPRLFPGIPVAILTNSANVHREEVAEIIGKFDVSFFKLDAGDMETFRTINRPLAGTIGFRQIVDGLKKVERLNLQTAVVRSPRVSNIPSLKGPFIALLKELKPLAVYIHNIDYPTPDPTIERLELEEMVELGDLIAEKSGTPVKVLHSLISLRGRGGRRDI